MPASTQNPSPPRLTWSDHRAVHTVIRYSDIPAPPQRWTLPLYLLQNPSTVAKMQTIINSHLADTGSANKRVAHILNNIQSSATAHVKASKTPNSPTTADATASPATSPKSAPNSA
jgi:hypothetical protein